MENEISKSNKSTDNLLKLLVRICNKFDLSFSITLSIGGMLVSGQLIGQKEYFTGFGETFSLIYKDAGEVIKEIVKNYPNDDDVDDDIEDVDIKNIHLKNVKFISPGSEVLHGDERIFWRGCIDSVDGFFIGEIS